MGGAREEAMGSTETGSHTKQDKHCNEWSTITIFTYPLLCQDFVGQDEVTLGDKQWFSSAGHVQGVGLGRDIHFTAGIYLIRTWTASGLRFKRQLKIGIASLRVVEVSLSPNRTAIYFGLLEMKHHLLQVEHPALMKPKGT
ncbi:hypothetical protein KY289_008969 [Solanum tuberosum]|nr:hypothetical protein KY289_008969 [Solanum tuberosum]